MEFDHAFSVAAQIDTVWAALGDAEQVASCIPNARLAGRTGDNAFDVEIEADVGLLTLKTNANVEVAARDDAAHREELRIVASEDDGDQLADATSTIVLAEAGGRSLAAVHTSVDVGGIGRLV